jgi:two-component system nitrate/nitrite response regulator NarL
LTEAKSIIVVDDHSIFRTGVVQIFSDCADIEVVGEGASSADAVALAGSLSPDMTLLDISMPGGGIAACREIHSRWPDIKCIMLTVAEEEDVILQALDAGAAGYALKGIPGPELIAIVKAIAGGKYYVPPDKAARLLNAMRGQTAQDPTTAGVARLSPKEERTLRLLARGFSNRQIAEATGVQVQTVKFHVSNILEKLKVASRVEAALLAQRHFGAD